MERTVLFGEGVGEKGEGALLRGAGAYSNKYSTYPFKNSRGGAGLNSPSSAFQSFSNLNIVAFKKKISTCSLIMNTSFDINWVTLSLKI